MATPDDPLIGTVLDGRYRLERKLEGGSYVALGLGREREVVVELFDPGIDHAQFERDAKASERLDHPKAIAISDFGIHDGRPFVVTEQVAGAVLADELKRAGKLPLTRAVAIARDLLKGLAHAHALGLVHGDITPREVTLVTAGDARLRWPGLARASGHRDEPAADQVSSTGGVRGTPAYMAPEQALGKPIDARTDLYAVSAVLYELLVGRPPFAAREPLKLLNLHVNQAVPAMSEGMAPGFVPPEVEAAVKCGLAKDPAERHQSAEEYIAALDAAVAAVRARDADTTTRMSGMSARLPNLARLTSKTPAGAAAATGDRAERRGSRAGLIVALLILLAAGGAIAYVMLTGRDDPASTTPPGPPPPKTTTTTTPPAPPTKTKTPAPQTPPGPAPAAEAWRPALDAAVALIAERRLDDAQRELTALRRDHPDAAPIHQAMGQLFLARNWPEETLAAYREAIAADPGLRTDPAIIAGAISLLDSNSRWWDAARLLERDVDARAALADAAEHDLTPIIRERARAILAKLK